MIVKIVGALLSLIAVGTSLIIRRWGFILNGFAASPAVSQKGTTGQTKLNARNGKRYAVKAAWGRRGELPRR